MTKRMKKGRREKLSGGGKSLSVVVCKGSR
jgi:hypothetical protein